MFMFKLSIGSCGCCGCWLNMTFCILVANSCCIVLNSILLLLEVKISLGYSLTGDLVDSLTDSSKKLTLSFFSETWLFSFKLKSLNILSTLAKLSLVSTFLLSVMRRLIYSLEGEVEVATTGSSKKLKELCLDYYSLEKSRKDSLLLDSETMLDF